MWLGLFLCGWGCFCVVGVVFVGLGLFLWGCLGGSWSCFSGCGCGGSVVWWSG